MTKKCDFCGREFEPKEDWHRFCSVDCRTKAKGETGRPRSVNATSGRRPNTATNFKFGPEYLRDGYFEKKGKKIYLRAEYLDQQAIEIAKLLGNRQMKTHQIRRIFNKARGIQAKFKRDQDFEAIKEDIFSLKHDVAYQVGRKIVPEEFQQFIEKNVELAKLNEPNFQRGFMSHFESVLAYFVYYFRE